MDPGEREAGQVGGDERGLDQVGDQHADAGEVRVAGEGDGLAEVLRAGQDGQPDDALAT